jgi:hypothetical protein
MLMFDHKNRNVIIKLSLLQFTALLLLPEHLARKNLSTKGDRKQVTSGFDLHCGVQEDEDTQLLNLTPLSHVNSTYAVTTGTVVCIAIRVREANSNSGSIVHGQISIEGTVASWDIDDQKATTAVDDGRWS